MQLISIFSIYQHQILALIYCHMYIHDVSHLTPASCNPEPNSKTAYCVECVPCALTLTLFTGLIQLLLGLLNLGIVITLTLTLFTGLVQLLLGLLNLGIVIMHTWGGLNFSKLLGKWNIFRKFSFNAGGEYEWEFFLVNCNFCQMQKKWFPYISWSPSIFFLALFRGVMQLFLQ